MSADDDRPSWRRVDTIALLVVTLAAGFVRLWQITVPNRIVFDETYYAHDACVFVKPATACGGIGEAFSEEHPLLAKWIVAAGIRLFGYEPFGWRVMPALAGTAAVALTFLLGWRLLRSTVAATLAAGLLAVDGLHFVLSRVAMLDVFVSTFSLATILFVSIDRDRDRERRAERERLRDRPWLIAAGVAGGAAVATKWSGIPFVVMAAVLVLVWDGTAAGKGRGDPGASRQRLLPIAIALIVIPLAVYALSFAGRLDGQFLAAPWDRGSWAWAFLRRQVHILTFHADLSGAYPYESPAWSWPLLKRPVVFAFETDRGFREILALGNPVVWWLGTVAVVACAVRWLRNTRGGPEGVILAGVAAGYLWWLPVTSSRSFSFLFYFLPAVPFLALAIALVAQRTWHAVAGRVLTALVAVAAVAAFAFFLPVLTFRPLDAGGWTSRLWFTACRPGSLVGDPPRPQSATVTRPPDGWCWI